MVFDINYKSILGIHEINKSNFITAEYENIVNEVIGKNKGEVRTNRNDHLQRIFKNYDFIFSVFDQNGNEISSLNYAIEKDNENLKYIVTGEASLNLNIIKFYLNEKFKTKNIPYIELNGTSEISYITLFSNKNIPFLMLDKSGNKIEEITYKYDNNYIYITIENKFYSYDKVSKFIYLLGIDDTKNYNEFKDNSNKSPTNLSTYDHFLYQETEEIKNIKFNFDDENKTVNIIGNLSYPSGNFQISTECADQFDVHILPYNNNVKYINISDLLDSVEILTSYVEPIEFISSVGTRRSIKKRNLVDTNGNQINFNSILKKITKYGTNEEVEFNNYYWSTTELNINFNENINDQDEKYKLEFVTPFLKIEREFLNSLNNNKVISVKSNLFIGRIEDNKFKEINDSYYYIWKEDYLKIYFKFKNENEFESFLSSNYIIKFIDFFSIYQFNVDELNYFAKTLNVNVDVYNYDDDFLPMEKIDAKPVDIWYNENNNYISKSVEGNRNPLYWLSYNLYKYDNKKQRYVLNQSEGDSSYFGYQKTTFTMIGNDNPHVQSHVYLNKTFNDMQGNASYKTIINTKFLKNNKYELISLYDGINSNTTLIDDEDPQTLTYKVLYPYVNFFGNFYDINGNTNENSYITQGLNNAYYYSEEGYYYEDQMPVRKYYPVLSYKISLINTNPNLSSDLSYEYKSPEIENKYGYAFTKRYEGWRYGLWSIWYSRNWDAKHYQFMFKHGAFPLPPITNTYYYDDGNLYNQFLESIYPGTYKLNVSLYNSFFDQNGQNNKLNFVKYDEENPIQELDLGEIELTKEAESTSGLYDYHINLPLITVSGKVINEADNSLVYGQDLTIEFINKEDSTKSRKFIYDCYFGSWNNTHDFDNSWTDTYKNSVNWTKDKQNRLNQTFLFKLFGNKRKYLPIQLISETNGQYTYTYFTAYDDSYPSNAELKHFEPGLFPGIYDVKVYYKDIVFEEINNFEISEEKAVNGELSSLIFISPLIDFSGKIVSIGSKELGKIDSYENLTDEEKEKLTILSGQNWSISIFNGDNLIRRYRYGYSLNETDMNQVKQTPEDSFKFENLPLSTSFDFYRNYRFVDYDYNEEYYVPINTILNLIENSEWRKERELRYALTHGLNTIQIKYKNKVVFSEDMLFTKEEEIQGKYKNCLINVGDILKDFSIKFIDDQTGLLTEMTNHLENSNEIYNFKIYLKIYDENYDGNLEDDQFNGSSWGTGPRWEDCIENSYTFKNQFIGYYKLEYTIRTNYSSQRVDTPEITDVTESITNESIYKKANVNPVSLYDVINLSLVDSTKTYYIHLKYWYGTIHYAINKMNENNINEGRFIINDDYIYTKFYHKTLENTSYEQYGAGEENNYTYDFYDITNYSQGNTIFNVKTGEYTAQSYLKLPNGNEYPITNQHNVSVKKWDNEFYIFNNIHEVKNIKFIIFGKVNENKVYKVPNQATISPLNFSDSLTGSLYRYSKYSDDIKTDSNEIFNLNGLINGLNFYYSMNNLQTIRYDSNSYANIINICKLNNGNYDMENELNHLISSNFLNISEIDNNYDNILEEGRFQIENLKNNGTYLLILDKYYVHVTLQVRDSNGNNSLLNYNFYIYDENNNLVRTSINDYYHNNNNEYSPNPNYSNPGIFDLKTIKAGKYKVILTYQGIDVTPSSWREYKEWYTEMGIVYIDLEFSLKTFTSTILYPGKNNELLGANCTLAINVTKLKDYDKTLINTEIDSYYGMEDEITYYFKNRYGNYRGKSSIGYLWSSSSSGLELNELMNGLYKIKIFYQDFMQNNYEYGSGPKTGGYLGEDGGRFNNRFNYTPEFPLIIPKSHFINISQTFNKIENFDLAIVHEYINFRYDGSSKDEVLYKYTTGGYKLSMDPENNENFIITKKEGIKTLEEYLHEKYSTQNLIINKIEFMITFGDLLKTIYILVNDNGIKEISENELSNYNTLKNETNGMNQTKLNDIILPYIYLENYTIYASGYRQSLHNTDSTTLKVSEMNENNNEFIYYQNRFYTSNHYAGAGGSSGWWTSTFDNHCSDSKYYMYNINGSIEYYLSNQPQLSGYYLDKVINHPYTQYALKSGHEYNFKYMKGNFILGETTTYLYQNKQINVNAVNIGSISGYIINKSLNRRVQHKIVCSIYEKSDYRNYTEESGWLDSTIYYDETINASSSGSFNFNSLLLNDDIKININEYYIDEYNSTHETHPSLIKTINGNIQENLEIPYEMYKITIEYMNNKEKTLTEMPSGCVTLIRSQGDEYDLTYNIGSGTSFSTYLRSGKYKGIIFRDSTRYNNISVVEEEQEPIEYIYEEGFTLDKDIKFTFRWYCMTNNYVLIKLGSSSNKLKIYDENNNLMSIKIPDNEGNINIKLNNVYYTFENVDQNGNVINSIRKLIDGSISMIDFTS